MIRLLLAILFVLVIFNRKSENFYTSTPTILMYGRDTCGYTVKMKKNIDESDKKHMFTYIDVTTPEGSIKYEKLNVQGVPAFSYNGKTVVGAMPIDNLLKKLNI